MLYVVMLFFVVLLWVLVRYNEKLGNNFPENRIALPLLVLYFIYIIIERG